MTPVPQIRIRTANQAPTDPEGDYVLYWMTAFRRLGWNFALQHATSLARSLSKPLVILEILLVDYPFASHRLHRFMLDGMAERSRALEDLPPFHYPFVERHAGEGDGLLSALASKACCVVVDDYPAFILPGMVASAGPRVPVRMEAVDSNGLLPLRLADRTFTAAYHFRRFLQKTLPDHFGDIPQANPLADPLRRGAGAVDVSILDRWVPTRGALLNGEIPALQDLPLDPLVPPVEARGGTDPAQSRLTAFQNDVLHRYHEDRNHPDLGATSGLSPYLHFGNISSHQIFSEVASREGWSPLRLSGSTDGSREGWWGMGEGAEAFLDQLITWRELGFNMTSRREDYASYESLPDWARATLAEHEEDPRPHLYSHQDFLEARTHDPIWNAAQRQLLEEGMIHNYLRMLWGKKILEWTSSPQEALEIMMDLNDRFALDGRDPNSYAGIFWCLGRYDRGWAERPVFGKVRSMSSERTRKKVRMEGYLERF
ncbi:deoxyribodipyrimidine photolyase, partial [Gemmatimonadota bacterium]